MTTNAIYLNPFGILDNFDFTLKLEPPCNLEEEEGDVPDIEELSAEEKDIIVAFQNWVKINKDKKYKFIGILINTETSSFEIALSDYFKNQRHFFKFESGRNFIILHNYIDDNKIEKNKRFIEKMYQYIAKLKISKVNLPVLVIIPYKGINSKKNNKDYSSLTINLKENIKEWSGELDDYITLIFRILFDAIESVKIDEDQPINQLKKLYNKQIKKNFGSSWNKKAINILNMPILSHILKLI